MRKKKKPSKQTLRQKLKQPLYSGLAENGYTYTPTATAFAFVDAEQDLVGGRLPSDPAARKKIPLASVLDYFPDALCAVAEVVGVGQVQHSTDKWDRSKSTDHADCLQRHFLDRGTNDSDGMRHTAKVAWRALAMLQLEIEAELGLPPSRGSK